MIRGTPMSLTMPTTESKLFGYSLKSQNFKKCFRNIVNDRCLRHLVKRNKI